MPAQVHTAWDISTSVCFWLRFFQRDAHHVTGGSFASRLATMIFKASLVWGVLALAATALPAELHISNKQPPPAYPIGQGKGSNAKVSGRVFNIDGRKGYFAGKYGASP